jgi:hypothetical protein
MANNHQKDMGHSNWVNNPESLETYFEWIHESKFEVNNRYLNAKFNETYTGKPSTIRHNSWKPWRRGYPVTHSITTTGPSISRPACARPNRRAHAHRASGIAILNSAISCWHPYPIIIGHWQTSGLKLLLLFIPCLS